MGFPCLNACVLRLRNVVLAHPSTQASYPVLVHRCRLLQSRFLHCCRLRQPACHLLWVRDVTLPPGRLPLPESRHTCCSFRFLFVFFTFSQTVQQVCSAGTCRAHTTGHKTCRFQWVFERFVPHQVLYRGIQTHLRNPARIILKTLNPL